MSRGLITNGSCKKKIIIVAAVIIAAFAIVAVVSILAQTPELIRQG